MLKDITNTYSVQFSSQNIDSKHNFNLEEQQDQAATTQSKKKYQNSDEKQNQENFLVPDKETSDQQLNSLTDQEILKSHYIKLKEQLKIEDDCTSTFVTLQQISIIFSKGKINAKTAQIDFLLSLGIIDTLISNLLKYKAYKNGQEMQNAVLWLLANVLALVQETQIIQILENKPLIEHLLILLSSDHAPSVEQTLWAIANLISYIPVRNKAIEKQIIDKILSFITKITKFEYQNLFTLKINRTLTWLLSNLCRKPSPPYQQTVHFLPYLATMIHFQDDQILRDTCLAIGNLVLYESNSKEDDYQQIEEVLNLNIGQRCIELLLHQSKDVQMAALVLLGHLTYGNEQQTQRLIESGVLDNLKVILQLQESTQRKKEAIFALSNIAASSCNQLEKIIASGIFELIKLTLIKLKNQQIMDECLFCFMNFTYNASAQQLDYLIQLKILEILVAQLKMRKQTNGRLQQDLQEAIENIVKNVKSLPDRYIKLFNTVKMEYLNKYIKKNEE